MDNKAQRKKIMLLLNARYDKLRAFTLLIKKDKMQCCFQIKEMAWTCTFKGF